MTNLREGLAVVGSALAFCVIACDGESKTDINDGNGGKSGDASGGASGGGGTVAQGGSSGAISGGTTGMGGSAGSGAGTSGSAGASMGGASGSAGTGSTAGRGYRPPDNQLSGCTRACELEQAAMCSAETTFDKCLEDCHLPLLFEACSDLWDAVFACVATAESAECNAEGKAIIGDCVDEAQPAFDCVLDGVTDDLATPCAANCAAEAAAMCPNDGDAAECELECKIIASAFPVCAPAYQVALECSADVEQSCDAGGKAAATGCATEFGAVLDCLDADYAWQAGRGIIR